MKYLITALCLFSSIIAHAQAQGPLIGFDRKDCYQYALRLLTNEHDTALTKLAKEVLQPNTRTIYVVYTEHVRGLLSLTDTVNGYKIKLVNIEENVDMLYEAQKDSGAVILYINKMGWYGTQHNTMMMPVKIKRKGLFRQKEIEYQNYGYKIYFIFENALNQYRFEKTEYVDYRDGQ